MTKTEVCEALERAAQTIVETTLLAYSKGFGDVREKAKRDAALLRTLKERIERGVVTQDAWGDVESLIIDWSEREGEAG